MTEVIVWSGWAGGLAVGLYALFQLYVTGKPLGASTGYGNMCSFISKANFFKQGEYENPNNWRLWFIIGLPLGGLLAALTSPGDITASFSVGAMYDSVLPRALWAKGLVLTLGGILIGYGARLANGCTSGHAIAGISLLNPPSVLSAAGFFIGGVIMVQFLFGFFG
jgi:uncharacterized membrane protein YedE/YeeE